MHSSTDLSVIMATQFVKWWKTKFHAGGCSYKSIVLGSNVCDGRPSDTEELVRDDASSSYNNGACVNPGLASSTISQVSHPPEAEEYLHPHSSQVKFEDFECDVQVESGGCEGEERKEFSFTFYDLDGHGKITKDDVAGLVRSIYGAVNDSITVPHGGKKTIKVKLTVTPEKSQGGQTEPTLNGNVAGSLINNINNNNISVEMGNSNSGGKQKLRNNVNVTIKENLNRDRLGGGSGRKEKELREKLSHLEKPKFNSVRVPNVTGCRGCRNLSPEVFRDCSASPLRNRKKWRERVCSLQRPDILEILQANMEKNNVNPCCRRDHTQPPPQPTQLHQHYPGAPCGDANCHLPAVGENLCKKFSDNPTPLRHHFPGKLYDTHLHRSSNHHTHQCRKHTHHRSRSHDLTQNLFRHHSFTDRDYTHSPPTCCTNLNTFPDSQKDPLEILERLEMLSPRNKNTNLTNAAASTPHQLKHRNREQEHARAMAQVISWLERENIGGCERKLFAPKNPSTNSILGSPPVVKKHEHHHVHEHIHHHYHHHFSKETPIIV